jgi:hypothetical protein
VTTTVNFEVTGADHVALATAADLVLETFGAGPWDVEMDAEPITLDQSYWLGKVTARSRPPLPWCATARSVEYEDPGPTWGNWRSWCGRRGL